MKTPAAPWPGRTGAKEDQDTPIFSAIPSRSQAKAKKTKPRPRRRRSHRKLLKALRP